MANTYVLHCPKCKEIVMPEPWPDWDGRCPFCGYTFDLEQ